MTKSSTIVVGIGEMAVSGGGLIATFALGSCVGIVLFDASHKIGGLAHVMLPKFKPGPRAARPAMYADTAIDALFKEMEAQGARRATTRARLAGGANILGMRLDIGGRNVVAARSALSKLGIRVVGEETGGKDARTVQVDIASGTMVIQSPGRRDRCLS